MFNESTMESSIDWLLFLLDMISFAIFFFHFDDLCIYGVFAFFHFDNRKFFVEGLKAYKQRAA